MGLLKPLGGEVTVHVKAPVEEVWALVSDVTRIGEFSPETFEARWTHGATGPEAGARFKGHVKRNGVGPTYWTPCTVTRCVENEVFEFGVGLDDKPVNTWGYRMATENGGTRVTEYFRLTPSWWIRGYWLVLGRLRGRTNERGMRTTLERMKSVLEEGSAA
ncbi:polyketide cyclase/dehydrase/lipid transport protein [Nocardioides sp. J9]|uniref:SRPBCC family protein n=1 Tax=Nocardioides sp. J9 TaxID=935844 RepID=UPI0011AA9B80|nr:SRPBCC family protein [Nocardioides sp. J9]TWG98145.1 polyketide cyclase/dehydrase/lipid transport protein [Nocardioides sp. J9]